MLPSRDRLAELSKMLASKEPESLYLDYKKRDADFAVSSIVPGKKCILLTRRYLRRLPVHSIG